MRNAGAVETLAQIFRHIAAVAEHQRPHHVGAAREERVDAFADGRSQAIQPGFEAARLSGNDGVFQLRRGIGRHAVAPQIGGKVKLAGIGGLVRRPQVARKRHALPRRDVAQRGNIAAQIEADVKVRRLIDHAHIAQPAGKPADFRVDRGRIRHRAGNGYGKLILQNGPRGNGCAHARRAKEKSAGHEQRGAAPAAQMQKTPGKQQYGGADQQDALRQPAVPRQKRAEAKERGGQHQRPRVQRTQRQERGAPAHAIPGNALRGGQVPRRDRLRAPRRAATQDCKGDLSG